jgi:predicted phage gp36 major capsid-like protein
MERLQEQKKKTKWKLLQKRKDYCLKNWTAMLKDAKIDGELMSSLGNSSKSSAAKASHQLRNQWLQKIQ